VDVGHTIQQPVEFFRRKRGAEARDPSRDLYSRCGNSLSFSLVLHLEAPFTESDRTLQESFRPHQLSISGEVISETDFCF
jgi:hypothetical protein